MCVKDAVMRSIYGFISLLLVAALAIGCGGNGNKDGGSLNGRLEAGDWILNSNWYTDRYLLVGTRDGWVQVDLSSNDFDPYLIAINENNDVIEDDDSGPGNDARLEFYAYAGETYEIRATSYDAFDTGRYRLSWSRGLRLQGEIRGRSQGGEAISGSPIKRKQ